MKRVLFLVPFQLVYVLVQCSSKNDDPPRDTEEDVKEMLYRDLSVDAYFNLPLHETGDSAPSGRRNHISELAKNWAEFTQFKYQIFNYDDEFQWLPPAVLYGNGMVADKDNYAVYLHFKKHANMNPDMITLYHLCNAASYIWREGRLQFDSNVSVTPLQGYVVEKTVSVIGINVPRVLYNKNIIFRKRSIHKYYYLKGSYYNHLPFEIGYLTQTIMNKYQNVLELFQYSVRLKEGDRKVGAPHMYAFYRNILEDCRVIIHLCNMMHEVNRKYRYYHANSTELKQTQVKHDPTALFNQPSGLIYTDKFPNVGDPRQLIDYQKVGFENPGYQDPAIFKSVKVMQDMLKKEKQRLDEQAQIKRWEFLDNGGFVPTVSTRLTKRWRPKDGPLLYGWESNERN